MDISSMGEMVHYYLNHSLADSTLTTYESGKRYIRFCASIDQTPLPVSEEQLCEFVASTAKEGLKCQTIKSYLAAVRHMQILAGSGDPLMHNIPLLEHVLAKRGKVRTGKEPHMITADTAAHHSSNLEDLPCPGEGQNKL